MKNEIVSKLRQTTMDLDALATGKSLLVWRSRDQSSWQSFGNNPCPMCESPILFSSNTHQYEGNWGPGAGGPGEILTETGRCPLCGWSFSWEVDTHGWLNTPLHEGKTSLLRGLELNASDVRLSELGAHLQKHGERLYDLSPRRFEELVTGIFGELVLEAIHTGRSGDAGADIVLFKESHSELWGIVECKRYARERRVKPEVLRALVGAAVDFGVKRAYLVTTGLTSNGLRMKLSDFRARGYELELVQATEILKLLHVYSEALPRLENLSSTVREEIIAENRKLWTADKEC
jgi:hypothetical protein